MLHSRKTLFMILATAVHAAEVPNVAVAATTSTSRCREIAARFKPRPAGR